MKIRIPKSKQMTECIIQYVLIMLCIIVHNTWFYSLNDMMFRGCIIGISLFFLCMKRNVHYKYIYIIFGIIIVMMFLMESIFSGVQHYKECFYICMFIIEPIIITLVTYDYNPQLYITRFIKCVFIVSLISLVFYLYSNLDLSGFLNSGLVKNIEGMKIAYTKYYCNILYAMRYNEPYKNLGPFCEPGLYQIILSTAIYLLVFYPDRVYIRRQRMYLWVFIITLITARSATGYISLLIITGGVMISKKSVISDKVKRAFLGATIVIVILMIINFLQEGMNGIVYTFLIEKLLGVGSRDITTGSVRLTSILECLKLLIMNPIGYGYSYVSNIFSTVYVNAVGATVFRTMAMVGILPIALLLAYFFKIGYKNRISNIQYIVLILLYFNTALAQSREFYPAILALFLIKSIHKRGVQNNEDISYKCT